jgi:hypothetical protein
MNLLIEVKKNVIQETLKLFAIKYKQYLKYKKINTSGNNYDVIANMMTYIYGFQFKVYVVRRNIFQYAPV